MRKQFEEPVIEVMAFEVEDIISASNVDPEYETPLD